MFANPWLVILPIILLISPLILRLAAKQDKKTKQGLRQIYTFILILQFLVGFLGWENAPFTGKSGLELAFIYPNSFLWLVFFITLVQMILLIPKKRVAATFVVILSFVNSFIIFASMIAISAILNRQIFSLSSIGETFLILIGNIIGLLFINKDKQLISKYSWGK